ncbi:hypothetical protein ISR94_00535 [Candidatus Microgenomates bacterium]|nr:hypothetical protein [Candidatus Microgenomates bacterium]
MLETPHVALGAAIATKIPNPWISIPLSFASHFFLDMVPHWNPHLNTETRKFGRPTKKTTALVIVDATTSLLLGSYIAFQASSSAAHTLTILACCFASVIPDLLEAPYFYLGMRHKFFKNWIKLQKSIQVDTTIFWGLSTQVLTVATTLFWIFLS